MGGGAAEGRINKHGYGADVVNQQRALAHPLRVVAGRVDHSVICKTSLDFQALDPDQLVLCHDVKIRTTIRALFPGKKVRGSSTFHAVFLVNNLNSFTFFMFTV